MIWSADQISTVAELNPAHGHVSTSHPGGFNCLPSRPSGDQCSGSYRLDWLKSGTSSDHRSGDEAGVIVGVDRLLGILVVVIESRLFNERLARIEHLQGALPDPLGHHADARFKRLRSLVYSRADQVAALPHLVDLVGARWVGIPDDTVSRDGFRMLRQRR